MPYQTDLPSMPPTVASFAIQLTGWGSLLSKPDALAELEAQILGQLESPIRLLRWAIVKAEPHLPSQPFWCEGAYLKNEPLL